MHVHDSLNLTLCFHLTRCLRTLRARLQKRRARRALVRATLCSRSRCGAREAMTVGCQPTIETFNGWISCLALNAPIMKAAKRPDMKDIWSQRETTSRAPKWLKMLCSRARSMRKHLTALSSQQDCISLALRAPLRDATYVCVV